VPYTRTLGLLNRVGPLRGQAGLSDTALPDTAPLQEG
jgi:hypothetical protein